MPLLDGALSETVTLPIVVLPSINCGLHQLRFTTIRIILSLEIN